MNDERKTKAELVSELNRLRRRMRNLENSTKKLRVKEKAPREAVPSIAADITGRKRAELQIKETVKWQKAIIEGSRDAVFLSDSESRFVFVNNAACDLTGFTRRELLTMRIPDLHEEPDMHAYNRFHKKIMQGEVILSEAKIRRSDGSKVDAEFNNSRIVISGTPYMHTTARDISSRRRAEAALVESETKLRTLFEILPVGVSILDEEGTVTYANPALTKILDISKEALIRGDYRTWRYLRPDESLMPVEEFAGTRAVKEKKTVYNVETGFVKENGKVVWTLVSAVPLALPDWKVVVVTADVSVQKRTKTALAGARSRLQLVPRRLLEVQENERRLLARELHDEIGQILTSIKIDVQVTRRGMGHEELAGRLDNSIDAIDQCIQRVRNLSINLRPPMLDDLGLIPALGWQLNHIAQLTGFHAQFITDEIPKRFHPDIATGCFRIAQEALTNVARHANAKHVKMELRLLDREIILNIRDDGEGFDVESIMSESSHTTTLGVLGMHERAALLNGTLEITSTKMQGTNVSARFPLRLAEVHS